MKDYSKHTKIFETKILRSDLKQKTLRGGLYSMIGKGISFILRLGSIAVLARILIPEHFGLISMVTVLTVIAERFSNLGLSTATVQKKEITHKQVSNLFWVNVVFGIIIMLVLCIFSSLIARFYTDSRLIWITVAISTSFFWGGLTVQHQAILKRKMMFAKIVTVDIVANIFSIFIAIVLAVKGYGYWALVWKEITRSFFIAFGTWIVYPWIPGLPSRNANIGAMVRFGRDITGFNLITFFMLNLDQILIGKFFGPGSLGIYRQGSQLALLPGNFLSDPFNTVAEPSLSILQSDPIRYRRYYKKILTLISIISMPLAVFLFIHSENIILLLLGEEWIKAIEIFKIFALISFIRPVLSSTGLVMITCGQTKNYLFIGVANSIVTIIAIVIGLNWGVVGVALGHIIVNYTFSLTLIIFAFRNTPVSVELFLSTILPSVICSLAMGVALSIFINIFTIQNNFYAIAGSLPIAFIVYFAVWMLMPEGRLRLKEILLDIVSMLKIRKINEASVVSE